MQDSLWCSRRNDSIVATSCCGPEFKFSVNENKNGATCLTLHASEHRIARQTIRADNFAKLAAATTEVQNNLSKSLLQLDRNN
jgi:hypothetical protein